LHPRTGISFTVSVTKRGTHAIMRATGKSKTCVWRWPECFKQEGVGNPFGEPPLDGLTISHYAQA